MCDIMNTVIVMYTVQLAELLYTGWRESFNSGLGFQAAGQTLTPSFSPCLATSLDKYGELRQKGVKYTCCMHVHTDVYCRCDHTWSYSVLDFFSPSAHRVESLLRPYVENSLVFYINLILVRQEWKDDMCFYSITARSCSMLHFLLHSK